MLSLPDFRYKQVVVHFAGGKRERLRFRADNLLIQDEDGNTILQHSCHRVFALFIVGEISLTSVVVQKALQFGFSIILMKRNFRVVARINAAADGNTLLRMKQYGISPERKMRIARELIEQKRRNQASLLQGLRYKSDADKAALAFVREIPLEQAQDVRTLMGMEGLASREFFSAYFRPLGWRRREPRCKRDVSNLLLDIGYTYLFNFVESMLLLYGFDTYCGVLHTLFYHRKSLVCDIVEPFRCVIDSRIRKAHNLGQINAEDFVSSKGTFSLPWKNQEKYTRLFLKDILARKEDIFKFCRDYYRWFAQEKDFSAFPKFEI